MDSTRMQVNPPQGKRGCESNCEGLKDGTIDAIATDHAPHHDDEKKIEFQLAANGISGFELRLVFLLLIWSRQDT